MPATIDGAVHMNAWMPGVANLWRSDQGHHLGSRPPIIRTTLILIKMLHLNIHPITYVVVYFKRSITGYLYVPQRFQSLNAHPKHRYT